MDKNEIDNIFDDWNSPEIIANIKSFKGLINKSYVQKGIAEHINKNYLPLYNLYQNLNSLDSLVDDAIDLTKCYSPEDLLNLGYGDMTATEINRICNKQVFKTRDIGTDNKVINWSATRAKTTLNALLNHIGYQLVSVTKQKRDENKKKIKVYSYVIYPTINEETKCSKSDILKYFRTSFMNYDIVV